MNERIKKVRKDAGLTLEKFGAKIGVSASAVSYIESGKNIPSTQTIMNICRVFRVNEPWLRTGTGPPYRTKSRPEELAEIFEDLMVDETTKAKIIRSLAEMPEEFFDEALALVQKFLEQYNKE